MAANEYDRALERDYIGGVDEFPGDEEDFWFELALSKNQMLTREEWLKEIHE